MNIWPFTNFWWVHCVCSMFSWHKIQSLFYHQSVWGTCQNKYKNKSAYMMLLSHSAQYGFIVPCKAKRTKQCLAGTFWQQEITIIIIINQWHICPWVDYKSLHGSQIVTNGPKPMHFILYKNKTAWIMKKTALVIIRPQCVLLTLSACKLIIETIKHHCVLLMRENMCCRSL